MHHLRSLTDATAIAAALPTVRRLVVIGAGFIGLEVAAVARMRGIEVTVVETAARPLTRVLGDDAGGVVTELHEERGVQVRCSATVVEVRGADGVEGVLLDGGEFLPADLLLVGVGAIPNTEWLEDSGVQVDNGVVCDDRGRSSRPGVYAAGHAARWRNALTGAHTRAEQWQSALEQASVVADALMGGTRVWDTCPTSGPTSTSASCSCAGRRGRSANDGSPPGGPSSVSPTPTVPGWWAFSRSATPGRSPRGADWWRPVRRGRRRGSGQRRCIPHEPQLVR